MIKIGLIIKLFDEKYKLQIKEWLYSAEIGLDIQSIFFFVCKLFYMSHGSVIIGAESMYIKLRIIFKNRIH